MTLDLLIKILIPVIGAVVTYVLVPFIKENTN